MGWRSWQLLGYNSGFLGRGGPPRTSQRGASRLSVATGSEQVQCVSCGAVPGPGLASSPEPVQAQTPALPLRLQPPLTAKTNRTALSSGPMFWNPLGIPFFHTFFKCTQNPTTPHPCAVPGGHHAPRGSGPPGSQRGSKDASDSALTCSGPTVATHDSE